MRALEDVALFDLNFFHSLWHIQANDRWEECKCRNLNIGFATKCEVQGRMRPKVCLGVKHTLTNGG